MGKDYLAKASSITMSVENKLNSYGVMGLVFGPYGEWSDTVEEFIQFVAEHRARVGTTRTSRDYRMAVAMFSRDIRSTLVLIVHKGWDGQKRSLRGQGT